jgi:DNA primase
LQKRGLRDPDLIIELGLGYAPGGNLRRHLTAHGYSLDRLLRAGLINAQGRDALCRRIIFPCHQQSRVINLYGRSIGAAFPHRLLPRSKGGLFAWESVSVFSTIILVEGLFDLAVLWQAGFRNTTCAIGTQVTPCSCPSLGISPAATFISLSIRIPTKPANSLRVASLGAWKPPACTRASFPCLKTMIRTVTF